MKAPMRCHPNTAFPAPAGSARAGQRGYPENCPQRVIRGMIRLPARPTGLRGTADCTVRRCGCPACVTRDRHTGVRLSGPRGLMFTAPPPHMPSVVAQLDRISPAPDHPPPMDSRTGRPGGLCWPSARWGPAIQPTAHSEPLAPTDRPSSPLRVGRASARPHADRVSVPHHMDARPARQARLSPSGPLALRGPGAAPPKRMPRAAHAGPVFVQSLSGFHGPAYGASAGHANGHGASGQGYVTHGNGHAAVPRVAPAPQSSATVPSYSHGNGNAAAPGGPPATGPGNGHHNKP